MPTIEKFCAPGLFDPPTYSQGIKVTQAQTILFLSGQVAYLPDGTAAFRGDFRAQARGAYEAIKALVEAQGATMNNIVKITTYLTDIRYRVDLAPIVLGAGSRRVAATQPAPRVCPKSHPVIRPTPQPCYALRPHT